MQTASIISTLTAAIVAGIGLIAGSIDGAADAAAAERALDRFLTATSRASAEAQITNVIESGATFDHVYARLKRGRSYSPSVTVGVQRLKRRTSDRLEHTYALVIPDDYTPKQMYQVRVQLHGGIARPSAVPGREGIDRIPGSPNQIGVYPNGWVDAMWWYGNQVENIAGILDELKRTYNVDENRVYLTGISDGATGAYFLGLRDTTPWASFLPLNGHMAVLANPDTRADGDLHPGNAINKPWFIVNGGQDRLYPTRSVDPYIEHLKKIGTSVVYHPRPDAGHNVDWWPMEKDSFEQFVRDHPRDPLPDRLSWEAERTDRYSRAHWLVIDELGNRDGEAKLDDPNLMDLGLRVREVFPHHKPSGRVDLVRKGNIVEVVTKGVRGFTLLVSPDEFDFSAPLKVTTNGRVAFEGKLVKSLGALLKWSARDNDRTMLFGAEISVSVK
jgi:predicted esterase